MPREEEHTRSAALGDLVIASDELVELVACMRSEEAWTVPGHMARLVERACQKLTVLVCSAEVLAPQAPQVERYDCPDCGARGGRFVPHRSGARFTTCTTCEGKGYL